MNIILDYQPAVQQRAGIGRYTRLLGRYLPDYLNVEDNLGLFYFDFKRKADVTDIPTDMLRPCRLVPGKIIEQLWKRRLPPKYNWLAGKADLYHFTNFIIPPIKRKAKTVVTICDMSFMRHPECAEARNLAYIRSRIADTVKRADSIVTISEFSKKEIEHFFPASTGKVSSIYLGIDQNFSAVGDSAVKSMRKRLGLERPYILAVGTLEPRKNYKFLIDVFEILDADVDLVIAGSPGWKYGPILDRIKVSSKESRIHCLNYVGDGDLAALYSGAELYVMTSLYEGFGFPPLEAMQCGVPVVSSRGGSLEEVLGDAAEIVPSFDAEEWAVALKRNLTDSALRSERSRLGFDVARRYRWEETARQTAEVYRDVLGGAK